MSFPFSDPGLPAHLAASLRENAPSNSRTEAHLAAVIDQAVSNTGSLLRARLVHTTATAHGVDDDSALRLATGVEYYHLASLLLDDLPCMDDAVMRRGLTCPHRAHGEASVILASLALINRAYALIGFTLSSFPAHTRLRAQACLDACLGTDGLVGGQAEDLRFGETNGTPRDATRIALKKTAALFWLSIYFPALLASPSHRELAAIRALCVYWGLAYQAIDDLRDIAASPATTGKSNGRDIALGRPNIVVGMGLPAAQRRLERLQRQSGRALDLLATLSPAWACLQPFQRAIFEWSRNAMLAARAA